MADQHSGEAIHRIGARVLEQSQAGHHRRLSRLPIEIQPDTRAHSLWQCEPKLACLSRVIPPSTLAESYLWNTTEQEEQEAADRLLECERCPPRGGECENQQHEGRGPVWREGFQWLRCSRWQNYVLEKHLKACGYPERFLSANLSQLVAHSEDYDRALTLVSKWAEKYPDVKQGVRGGLCLQGFVGCGKTHIACSLARRLYERKAIESSRFHEVERLLLRLRRHDEQSQQVMDDAISCDLLILDDLNTHGATDWSVKQLALIINQRWSDDLPIIITANQSLEEQQLGDRITSRLAGSIATIEIQAPDYRKQG